MLTLYLPRLLSCRVRNGSSPYTNLLSSGPSPNFSGQSKIVLSLRWAWTKSEPKMFWPIFWVFGLKHAKEKRRGWRCYRRGSEIDRNKSCDGAEEAKEGVVLLPLKVEETNSYWVCEFGVWMKKSSLFVFLWENRELDLHMKLSSYFVADFQQ